MKRTTLDATNGTLSLQSLTGWDKLETTEQSTVSDETIKAARSLADIGKSKLSAGEHLAAVEAILKPRRIFTQYLNTVFHLSRATAYRYINLYKAAKTVLPAPVLEAAMMRSDDRLNLALIKSGPKPPRTTNVVKINEYLDNLQRGPRLVSAEASKTPEDVKKAMFHASSLLLRKVSGRQKASILHSVVGMLLTEIGVSNPMSFDPVAVPDTFRATRGRPRKAA